MGGAVPAPERAGAPRVGLGEYDAAWSIRAAIGAETLVQVVRTHVRWSCGDEVVVEYDGLYAEAIRVGADPVVDRHQLSVWRDGWSQPAVRDLLRTHGEAPAWTCRAPARLEATKTFTLGPGEVEGVDPASSFLLLAHGPGGPSAARIVLSPSTGASREVTPPSPCPRAGLSPAGRGRFTGALGWVLVERFTHDFSTDATRLDDGGGYRPAPLM